MISLKHSCLYDPEFLQRMLLSNRFGLITGATEYTATVSNSHEEIKRYLCRIERIHPDEEPKQYWCDTATGSLYTDDGRCLSGHLWMIDKPRKTGRKVPDMAVRSREQLERSASYECNDGV